MWWTRLPPYLPLQKIPLDLDVNIGKVFAQEGSEGRKRINFAKITEDFEDLVKMPGTAYYTTQV